MVTTVTGMSGAPGSEPIRTPTAVPSAAAESFRPIRFTVPPTSTVPSHAPSNSFASGLLGGGSFTAARPVRVRSNGAVPSLFDAVPARLRPSLENFPSKVAFPGSIAVNLTIVPSMLMVPSGTSTEDDSGMVSEPIQAPATVFARSTVTLSSRSGIRIVPSHRPDGSMATCTPTESSDTTSSIARYMTHSFLRSPGSRCWPTRRTEAPPTRRR
jgi:hypothetical protein